MPRDLLKRRTHHLTDDVWHIKLPWHSLGVRHAVWHAVLSHSRWKSFEQLDPRSRDDIMTPDADTPQVGLGPCPCWGQATPGEAAFTVENMISAATCTSCRLLSYFMKLNLWNSWLWMLSGIRVMGFLQDSSLLSKVRVMKIYSLIPPQPRAPTAPRSPKHFFPFTRVDRLAWNYFIIQTCLHVQLALVCAAPAEAHSVSRRSNFLNLSSWQLDDIKVRKS